MNQNLYFLPYMCKLSPEIEKVFCNTSFSHRSAEFTELYEQVKTGLCRMTGAKNVQILCGSGTLANDVIAWQLKKIGGKGVIFSNGEFGERLINHARHAELNFTAVREKWGTALSESTLAESVEKEQFTWAWFVHSETSTGGVNDIDEFRNIIKDPNVFICADCISSIGNLPVDLRGVNMASCSSNKGLGSYPGLCMVLYDHLPDKSWDTTPLYLDLKFYAEKASTPFTFPPPLLASLKEAMADKNTAHFSHINKLNLLIQHELPSLGFKSFSESKDNNPAVLTVSPPENLTGTEIGSKLKSNGIHIAFESAYLKSKNLVQIALMGKTSKTDVEILINELSEIVHSEAIL